MSLNPVFTGKVIGGRLVVKKQREFLAHIAKFNDQFVDVVVRKKTKTRSGQQNRYYHGVVIELIADHTGHTEKEVHGLLRAEHLSEYVTLDTQLGMKEFSIVRSTASLTTVEMEEYLTKCRNWASVTLDLYIPLPNEVDFEY